MSDADLFWCVESILKLWDWLFVSIAWNQAVDSVSFTPSTFDVNWKQDRELNDTTHSKNIHLCRLSKWNATESKQYFELLKLIDSNSFAACGVVRSVLNHIDQLIDKMVTNKINCHQIWLNLLNSFCSLCTVSYWLVNYLSVN